MEVTLRDIANELNVSAMTVSRSLRHDTTISAETRARVHATARRLGYQTRTSKTRRPVENEAKNRPFGLLLRHASLEAAHRDSALMKMLGGIMSVLDAHEIRVKMHTWPEGPQPIMDEDPAAIPPMIRDGECQALIVHGYHLERNLEFMSHRVPIVTMGRHYRDLPIDAVVADNVDGVHRMVTKLAELGHRRLAWVGAHYTASLMEARHAGFVQGCYQHGLEINPRFWFGPEIWTRPVISNPVALLEAVDEGVTAFVCGNDSIALDVINILAAAGLQLPKDVSVAGFDAWMLHAKMRQPMSIDPNFFEIGKAAGRLALQRLAFPMDNPCLVSVRGELIPGEVTAPPRHTG